MQTQLFYFAEFRDGFKRQWLEKFLHHDGIMNYHGFGGLKNASSAYLEHMLNSPPVDHEVKVTWGNRLSGGSKNNPYLQSQPKYNSYKETIHPQKVCKGLLEIREQLQAEWLSDLPVMEEEDALFAHAVRTLEEEQEDMLQNEKQGGEEGVGRTATLKRRGLRDSAGKSDEDNDEATRKFGKWNWDHYKDMVDAAGEADTPEALEGLDREQTAFAEATGGMVDLDDGAANLVRDDIMTIGVRSDQQSSPLRSKNYDVLKKAATYIAVKRCMDKWTSQPETEGAAKWFEQQWLDKHRAAFEGDSGRYLSDRFLTDIAAQPAVAVTTERAGTLHMVTPPKLAMDILAARSEVVKTFLAWLGTDAVQEQHSSLQRALIARSLASKGLPDDPKAVAAAAAAAEACLAKGQNEGDEGEDIMDIWKPKK